MKQDKIRRVLRDISWEKHLQEWEKTLIKIEKLEKKYGGK